jgi:hypothetical protein
MFRVNENEDRLSVSPDGVLWIVLIGAIGAVVGSVPLWEFVPVSPVPGLVVGFSVVAGFVGAVSVTAGYLVVAVVAGRPVPSAVLSLLAYVLTGYVAAVVWHGFPADTPGWSAPKHVGRRIGRGVGAVTVGAVAGGVVLAWGYEIAGIRPFYLAPRYAASFWVAGLVVGLPVVSVSRYLSRIRVHPGSDMTGGSPLQGTQFSPVVVVVPLVWGVVGVIASVGYRAAGMLLMADPDAFAMRNLSFLLVLYGDETYGPGGRRVQAAFGGVMLVLLVLALLRARPGSIRSRREGETV